MRVAFAGTPEFARFALAAILEAGFEVPLVLTQPDRPAGRGQKLSSSPVKQFALDHGIPVFQPERLKDPATHAPLAVAAPDVLVVAAYGLILPQAVLDIPKLGCLNIHASLLPRWRGAAPIQRAIEAGDTTTGITIMQMEAGLDTGPMLMRETLA
ncbi:MAG: methionyl-tRNA formyltransferase, partial [Rhodocyclaceae bacterium]|nr:methionyl-tRNA formyltransferase [Rhodocyclaceae bacterium]